MSTTKTKDGRFRIEHSERSDDSYMHSYTSESWTVISTETEEELASFSGRWDADSGGQTRSGTSDVRFSDDETEILARGYNNRVKRVPLPIAFRLSNDERFLIHVHRDGREKRTALYTEYDPDVGGDEGFRKIFRKEEAKRVARIKRALAKRGAKKTTAKKTTTKKTKAKKK